MLRLTLFRHAKSAWADDDMDDFDRPLTKRGQSAAATVAHAMIAAETPPSLILCSAARRARETFAYLLPQLRRNCRIEIEHQLYLASADALLARLHAIKSADTGIVVIGHNPGLHELALMLAKPAQSDAYQNLTAKFPTAALAELEFQTGTWSELNRGQGNLRRFLIARTLAREG